MITAIIQTQSHISQTPRKQKRSRPMKTNLLLSATALLAGFVFAANAGPKDDVIAAATKLGEKPNYSWKTTTVVPEGSRFRPGPAEGKTEKDGFTHLSVSMGESTTLAVL